MARTGRNDNTSVDSTARQRRRGRSGSSSGPSTGPASAAKEREGRGGGHSLGREAGGIVLLALALFVGLGVGSLQFGDGKLMGPAGAWVALGCYAVCGVGAYLGALLVGAWAVGLLRRGRISPRGLELVAALSGAVFGAVLVHLAAGSHRLHGYAPGGLVGEYGAEMLVALLGTAGTVLVALTGLLLSVVATTSLSMRHLGGGISGVVRRLGGALWAGFTRAALALFPRRDETGESLAADRSVEDGEGTTGRRASARSLQATQLVAEEAIEAETVLPGAVQPPGEGLARARRKKARAPETEAAAAAAPAPVEADAISVVAAAAASAPGDPEDPTVQMALPVAPATSAAGPAPASAAATSEQAAADAPVEEAEVSRPAIITPVVKRPLLPAPAEPAANGPADYIRLGQGEFRLPDLSLLDYEPDGSGELDRQAMLDLAQRLEKTLGDYGVKGRVSEIHPGPVVTMYEFVPQAGTKLSKITSLSNDLAMALEALKVRIVAPIPGKAAVGIEVPNRTRETVYLKEIIGSEAFARQKSKLSMALGKDIVGQPVCVDLARMPHLLVAGTTGSGKSVSVNGMICSMLFKASPDDVKLIMIDPKMLELSIYEGIPHLLLPVVTDPKKANLALRWAVEEMERRYELISKAGVRDILSYNKKVEKAAAGFEEKKQQRLEEAREPQTVTITVVDESGESREVEVDPTEEAVRAAGGVVNEEILEEISAAQAAAQFARMEAEKAAAEQPEKKLPYIVIIIDEFADLMMVASKDVEMSVARIAQKARAAGIHLLLATQRPSVDVITGLIKANFPSRIAFQVVSKIDARTILDQQGAESLLGMGDMLFTDRGQALRRVHGPLVTDVEIHRMVDYLKSQGKPVYDLDILKPREGDEEGGGASAEEDNDEMYDQAVRIVAEMRQASTSMLQRRLRLGYNRAARMIERMEREGIVGPADGARPREVLVSAHAA